MSRPSADAQEEYVVLIDPLVASGVGGWCGRVAGLMRQEFRRLAALAAAPALLVAAYSVAMALVQRSPDEVRTLLARAAHNSPTGKVPPWTGFEIVFGRTLPVTAAFMVMMVIAGALYQGATFLLAVRWVNGQPTGYGDALRFAFPRVPAVIGWNVVFGLVVTAAATVPPAPGILAHAILLFWAGVIVSVVLVTVAATMLFGVMSGVILVERAGLGRAWALIRPRLGRTINRLVLAGIVYIAYSILSGLLITWVGGLLSSVTAGATLQALFTIPGLVLQTAVSVVTYVELRHAEDTTVSTRSVAAELSSDPLAAA